MENWVFATQWVHVFEEDTAAGAVYRPQDADIPLSRRPRERLELDADGKARLLTQGPDDRYVAQAASWQDENDGVMIRTRGGSPTLRIVERSPARLLIQTQPTNL
jgi:hypothetical protein